MTTGIKISALTTAGTLTGDELVPVVQSGETRQTTALRIGALADVELANKVNRDRDFMTEVQYLAFDTSVVNGLDTGILSWNANDGTLDVGLLGGSILQLGQESLYYVKNPTGSTIPDGSLVMATGTVGASGKIEVGLADGSGAVSAEFLLGVATQDIPAGQFGYVTHFGLVRGLNTTGTPYGETWADNDLLYASPSTPGALTNVVPPYPGFSTPLAIVINAAPGGAGSIFVRMKSGEYLEQLHDVDVSTKASGDILLWNVATSAWTNSQALVSVQADVSVLQLTKVSVSNGDIWNPTVTNYTETVNTPASVSSYAIDLSQGTIHRLATIGAETCVSLPPAVNGKSFVVIVDYGGAHALTWTGGTTIRWPGGVAPVASSSATASDIFTFIQDTSSTYGNIFARDL
jgi:hypothetical protein